jgi:SET domain-containing protein
MTRTVIARREPLFEVRASTIQGQGVFATRRIRKGTRIIEYIGERIDDAEADARYDDDAMKRHHTFLFGIDQDTYIDAARGGNESRLINHSCDPNCAAYEEDRRIYIEAIRTIRPGEELSYDYRLEREGRPKASWKLLYPCHCGSENCRGTMLKPTRRRRVKRRRRS